MNKKRGTINETKSVITSSHFTRELWVDIEIKENTSLRDLSECSTSKERYWRFSSRFFLDTLVSGF